MLFGRSIEAGEKIVYHYKCLVHFNLYAQKLLKITYGESLTAMVLQQF